MFYFYYDNSDYKLFSFSDKFSIFYNFNSISCYNFSISSEVDSWFLVKLETSLALLVAISYYSSSF